MIAAIVEELAPNLIARNSIGHVGAAQLLLTADGNPERQRSEASFASLCGVRPVPASLGKTVRHKLNRGGDRAANSALHIIAIGRLRTAQRTKNYIVRRIAEGHSKLDAIRPLKRYLARGVFTLVTRHRREINATQITACQAEGRQRQPIRQHSIHRAPSGGGRRALGRQRRRQLQQCPSRNDQHPPTWTMALVRSRRVRTLEWVDWFNNRRLLEPIGNIPPAEAEERYYATLEVTAMAG
jgi:hypothetical protein